MADISRYLFFDLEYNPSNYKVREFGYVFGNVAVRARADDLKSRQKLFDCASQAECIVGHNLLRHDNPILREYFAIDFPDVKVIDTLMLSSLVFPRQPYHRLRKEYLHDENEPSDPLKDAQESKQLLLDCVEKWETFPWQLRSLIFRFLRNEPGFKMFFDLVDRQKFGIPEDKKTSPFSKIVNRFSKKENPKPDTALVDEIKKWFVDEYSNKLCLHHQFEDEWNRYRAEWSFLLTLFYEEGPSDFVPYWVRYQYPHLESILTRRRLQPCNEPGCPYCENELNSVTQLKKWFGFPGFRKFQESETVPVQQQVVEAALRGESLLAVFPTGGGKSITFQLPALIAGAQLGALTVVITPIVALMKDQVDVLEKRRQIGCAAYLNSLLSPLERKQVVDGVYEGSKNILYLSPESLRSNNTFKMLKHRRVARIVIDEAHCFSSWGHDFRVDYLYLADFLKELQQEKKLEQPIPISCFTATAKQSVVDDICNYFKNRLDITLTKFVSPAKRVNLTYSVLATQEDKKVRERDLVMMLRNFSGPKIVYASRVKTTEELAEHLSVKGFASACYNGQMEAEQKMKIQDDFQNGTVDTMVATTAFGMGVDKDNVELVAHYELSSTLENYVQEAGRAGRNPELKANCIALYHSKDLNTNYQILQRSKLSAQEIGEVWRVVKASAASRDNLTISALELADKCGWTDKEEDSEALTTKVKQAILVLEEQGFLKRKRNKTLFYGSSISVETVEEARKVLGTDAVDVSGSTENIAFRMIRHIVSKRWTRSPECAMDELMLSLGISLEEMNVGLRLLRANQLLAENDDWSARIQRLGKNNCHAVLNTSKILLTELLNHCKSLNPQGRFILDLVKLNTLLNSKFASLENSLLQSKKNLLVFRGLLRYFEHRGFAEHHLVNAAHQIYQLEFKMDLDKICSEVNREWKALDEILKTLLNIQKEQQQKKEHKNDTLVWFSLNQLIVKIYGETQIKNMELQKRFEFFILFLHLIGAIALDHGLAVFYTGLVLEPNEDARKRKFQASDFESLDRYYKNKAESIYIVGEYAKLMLQDSRLAQELLDDYFSLAIEDFRLKYLNGEMKGEAVSDELKTKILKLNEEQRKVINSRNKHILVGAGPGSGKTHLLVHKAASLLWLEEAKPDSLLILTYTRAACRELKKRLFDLAGNIASKVTISTFHSLAFSVLGLQGDKKALKDDGVNGEGVIEQAASYLEENDDVHIGIPSVMMVDEFQDLSAAEYRLLKALYNLGEKEPRVIVVGDDDQSIFGFRGSSSEYFKKFAEEFPNTKSYYLTTNYRSCAGIVRSNESLLSLLKNRVKEGVTQQAKNPHGAELCFYEASDKMDGALFAAEKSIEILKKTSDEKSSCGLLTHNNIEALLMAAKLEQQQVHYKFLKGVDRDKCTIENIREVQGFRVFIEERAKTKNKVWNIEDFNEIVAAYKKEHQRESSFELLDALIVDFIDFETACGETDLFLGQFLNHLSEVTFNDLEKSPSNSIAVGTMHSCKGLEFDHVVISLAGWNMKNCKNPEEYQENLRLLYVACTRAKKSITVIGSKATLPEKWISQFKDCGRINAVERPKEFNIDTDLSNINLGHFIEKEDKSAINNKRVRQVQELLGKIPLESPFEIRYQENFGKFSIYYAGKFVTAFSKTYNEKNIGGLLRYGFVPATAELHQVCRWQAESGQSAWVPLLKVKFVLKI